MIENLKIKIPEPTIRRLANYRSVLINYLQLGIKNISSATIADELDLDSIQVRKDIQHTGIVGLPKVGYEINKLINAIDSCLNWNRTEYAILVGAGSLGSALLGYEGFRNNGVIFVAAFDTNKFRIGTNIHAIKVFESGNMMSYVKMMKIRLGVLTVPAIAAQECARQMVEAGIKAIWNFTPVKLKVPHDVIVENAQVASSLAVLTSKLGSLPKE